MDREKVIRLIEEEISVCELVDQCYRTIDLPALRDILALLKEQEAVEPIRKKLKFSETWECGNCHEELFEGEVIRYNYCPNCGRSVKWE